MVDLIGTKKSNKLKGKNGKDVIFGDPYTTGNEWHVRDVGGELDRAAGHDKIFGYDDKDRLCGDAWLITKGGSGGYDTIDGGSGNDTILGDAFLMKKTAKGGDDTIDGGIGEDLISGDADVMKGKSEAGHDIIKAGDGDDFIHGDARIMTGSAIGGRDDIDGGDGNDWIFGDAGFAHDRAHCAAISSMVAPAMISSSGTPDPTALKTEPLPGMTGFRAAKTTIPCSATPMRTSVMRPLAEVTTSTAIAATTSHTAMRRVLFGNPQWAAATTSPVALATIPSTGRRVLFGEGSM